MTVGMPTLGTEVRLLDPDGRDVPAGETGRIFVSNGVEFEGYTDGQTKEVIDGVMSSGDVGHFDDAGRLFIDGRDDDMIVSGGENVFPQEVEELLMTHELIADAAVIGVPDEDFGARLKAFVVAGTDEPPSPDELQTYVKSQPRPLQGPARDRVLERAAAERDGEGAEAGVGLGRGASSAALIFSKGAKSECVVRDLRAPFACSGGSRGRVWRVFGATGGLTLHARFAPPVGARGRRTTVTNRAHVPGPLAENRPAHPLRTNRPSHRYRPTWIPTRSGIPATNRVSGPGRRPPSIAFSLAQERAADHRPADEPERLGRDAQRLGLDEREPRRPRRGGRARARRASARPSATGPTPLPV